MDARVLKLLEKSFHIPHTLVLFVLSTLFSYGYTFTEHFRRFAADASNSFSEAQLLVVFLPALAFHATHGVNFYVLRRCLVEILLFAVGTTGISVLPLLLDMCVSMVLSGACGVLWALLAKATMRHVHYHAQSTVTFIVASAYALFALLKLYGGCGILGVIFFCVMISTDTLITSTGLEDELKRSRQRVVLLNQRRYWEVLHDISEVISLLLCALYIGVEITPNVHATELGASFITYVVAVASRPQRALMQKSVLKSGSGGDDFGGDGLGSVGDSGEGGERSFQMSLRERVIDLFENPYYDLVQCSVTVSAASCLAGVLLFSAHGQQYEHPALALQTAYLAAFVTEMSIMVFAYGQRFVRIDQDNLLDLVLVVVCSALYGLQMTFLVLDLGFDSETVRRVLATMFVCTMLLRLVHFTPYAEELGRWGIGQIHRYMDSIIYTAYETGLALIKGEEDVRENIWKTVDEFMADQIRVHAGENRLELQPFCRQLLRQVVEVHSKYPGVTVAFKSRQACQTILNDVRRHIDELLRNGAMDSGEHRKMITMSIRPMSFGPGAQILPEYEDTHIVVTTSGIVKVCGEVTDNAHGALPNSASFMYFYSDGYFEDYILAPDIVGTLSIVSDEPCVTTVTAETAVNVRDTCVPSDAAAYFERAPFQLLFFFSFP
ncbi:hypothetical protein V5799_026872 [Amblyomma americanum]|uniref:Uncharacterized protein n=1 Tax=Amblyomma americanum TaxID=6943 RepID=A0AAQ4DHD5_AMBAM